MGKIAQYFAKFRTITPKSVGKEFSAIEQFLQYFGKSTYAYKNRVLYASLFFLIFQVIQPYVNLFLDRFFVKKVISLFHPSISFDIALLILTGIVIFLNLKRKLKAFDLILFAVYVDERFFDSFWNFWPMFQSMTSTSFRYADLVGIYYVLIIGFSIYGFIKEIMVKKKEEFADGFLYPDLSLDKLSIRTNTPILDLDRTGLNRNKFAILISDIIHQTRPFQAYAIGVCGPWGSGKSSLLTLIVENLKKRIKERHYLFVDFSPWFFSNPESLVLSFFSVLESKFKRNKSLASEFKTYAKEISMLEKSILNTGFSDLIFDDNIALKNRYESLIDKIKAENKTIIISIDDLDRLHKSEVIEVFRLIRLIANFPNTFYLVAYDRNYINSAIREELTKYNPEKYADKIFNFEVTIPNLSSEMIRSRLSISLLSQVKLLGDKIGWIDEAELNQCFNYVELDKFIKTERDIKRFTNKIIVRYLSIKEEVNFYHFFLLELIFYYDQQIFNQIFDNKDVILNEYEKLFGNQDVTRVDFGKFGFSKVGIGVTNVLDELFKKNTHLERYALSNRLYFTRYFILALLENDFSDQEFKNAIKSLPLKELQIKLVEFNSINSPLLAEKLTYEFKSIERLSDDRMEDILEAFLFLFNEVFYSKRERQFIEGLSAKSLSKLFFDFYKKEKKALAMLEKRIMKVQVNDYAAFSYLVSAERISLFLLDDDKQKAKECFVVFKKVQLEFLKIEIQRSGGTVNARIIGQIMWIKSLSDYDFHINENENYFEWFFNNVIIEFGEFLRKNVAGIIDLIKTRSTKDDYFNLADAKQHVQNIFLDIESKSHLYVEQEFERIRDFYLGLDTIKVIPYTFSNQYPLDPNHPEYNDHQVPDVFELTRGSYFEIEVTPINTEFWRFGFRLSKKSHFPAMLTSRHIDDYPFIHLTKGHIDGVGGGNDEDPVPNLYLTVYTGIKLEYEEKIASNYLNGKISIFFYIDADNAIHVKVFDGILMNSAKVIGLFKEFRFMKISAWADRRKFTMSSRIKVLKQIDILSSIG